MADLPVFFRKFLQDHSGPVFHAAYGKDRVCSLWILWGCVCVWLSLIFFSTVPLISVPAKGLFLFLKPSSVFKKLGFKNLCVVCSLIQNSNFALNRWLQISRKEHVNSNTHKGRVHSSNPHDVGLVLLPCKIKMKADISGIGKGQLFVARDLAKSEAPWTTSHHTDTHWPLTAGADDGTSGRQVGDRLGLWAQRLYQLDL